MNHDSIEPLVLDSPNVTDFRCHIGGRILLEMGDSKEMAELLFSTSVAVHDWRAMVATTKSESSQSCMYCRRREREREGVVSACEGGREAHMVLISRRL